MLTGEKPAYDLSIGEKSLLPMMGRRAASIEVTDCEGTESDTLNFTLDVSDRGLALPRKGVLISCSLGFAEEPLTFMGLFTADTVSVSGPTTQLKVSAKAAEMRKSFKEHRTKGYESKTLGDIINEVAGRHGLGAAISSGLASRFIPYVGQTEESDLHFVTRLARAHGAIAKPANGKLVFVKRGEGKTASGASMPALTLTPAMVTEWNCELPDRPAVKEVKAHWHDRGKGERKTVKASAGGEDSAFVLRHDFPTEDEAQWAADGKASEMKASGGSFSATLKGTPTLGAGAVVMTSGFYPGTEFTWIVKTATHSWTTSGTSTQIECELKP